MKKLKSIIAISLVLLLLPGLLIAPAQAADTSSNSSGRGNYVYFDASGWKNYTQIFCHIWVRDNASFFGWQAKREQCENDYGDVWKYDLSKLDQSTDVEGGLKNGVDYCVIFSANTGVRTYDTTFGLSCIGDTAKMTTKMIENAVDSEKQAYECVWTKNSSKYGPHLAISSIGNIIGSVLCPNESGMEVIGDWLPVYYTSSYVDAEAVLVEALPKFGVKEIDSVYAYIVSKQTGEDEKKMLEILTSAYKKAYGKKAGAVPSSLYIGETCKVALSGISVSKTKFSSNKKSVATVSAKGIVTAKKAGSVTITIKFDKITIKKTIKIISPKITIKNSLLLFTGDKYVMKAKVKPAKGGKVTWTSSNKRVAKVSSSGKIVAVSKGKTYITATLSYKGKTYKSRCTVGVVKL